MREVDGFGLVEGPGPTAIHVHTDRLDDCLRVAAELGITHFLCNPILGYRLRTLAPLLERATVRGLYLNEFGEFPLEELYACVELEALVIDGTRGVFDLARVPTLASLSCAWFEGLKIPDDHPGLRSFHLFEYRPKSFDLSGLFSSKGLRVLSVINSSLRSVEGIERFPAVEELRLSYLRGLRSLAPVARLRALRVLHVQNCRKALDAEALSGHACLENLRLVSGPDIASLGFLDSLPTLKRFVFMGSAVTDGDMRPLLRLEGAWFDGKPWYSHKEIDVRRAIHDRLVGG
jgi:hypothetical protein